MRCTQPMGLPEEAKTFLANNAVRLNICPHCSRDDGFDQKAYAHVGMFDDLPLYEYRLKDGRVASEVVQREIWSSGPMIWLSLKIAGTDETFEWSEEAFEGAE